MSLKNTTKKITAAKISKEVINQNNLMSVFTGNHMLLFKKQIIVLNREERSPQTILLGFCR